MKQTNEPGGVGQTTSSGGGPGYDPGGVIANMTRASHGKWSKTTVPPSKGRKHGSKAGRRKGGGRGGRH